MLPKMMPRISLTNALVADRVASVEGWFLYRTSWEGAVEAAQRRNTMG